jgi:hypothetical protein
MYCVMSSVVNLVCAVCVKSDLCSIGNVVCPLKEPSSVQDSGMCCTVKQIWYVLCRKSDVRCVVVGNLARTVQKFLYVLCRKPGDRCVGNLAVSCRKSGNSSVEDLVLC